MNFYYSRISFASPLSGGLGSRRRRSLFKADAVNEEEEEEEEEEKGLFIANAVN